MAKPIEPFYQTFGDAIRQTRRKVGLSQGELGAKLCPQVTRASIANIENGKQRVLVHTLIELADILGVEVHVLLPNSSRREAKPEATLEAELARKLAIPTTRARDLLQWASKVPG